MTRRRRRRLIALFLVLTAAAALSRARVPVVRQALSALGVPMRWWARGDGVFEVRPYLQPGGDSPDAATDGLSLIWQTADAEALWSLDVRRDPGGPWEAAPEPTFRKLALHGERPARLFHAALPRLEPGSPFSYRVKRSGAPVFEATAHARPAAGRPQRFVVVGDVGAGTYEQQAVAYQVYRARPDYVVVTGDVVYQRGRGSEYLDRFFPVYNDDRAASDSGAPQMRSTLMFAAPGNHDLVDRDLDRLPDGLAYFYYFDPPRNGPLRTSGSPGTPTLKGAADRQRAFLDAAGSAYPVAASYSLELGDVHWTVLDANPYADWTDPALSSWLEADLASPAARRAAWRFVAMHHPMFNSSHAHADDQRMRVIAPAVERGKVDVVFAGHVHNYQRTRPVRFEPASAGTASPYGKGGRVEGRLTIDRRFDGVARTRPDGPIYVVTGAGGARLYDTRQGKDEASWQPFTVRFVSDEHSFTVVDATPTALTVRQVSADAVELDRFTVTR